MELQVIAFYFFADELLKASHLYDDPQAKMTNAEIITTVLTAAQLFCGNQRTAAHFLKTYHYIPNFLSESRFNRRLHRIPHVIWEKLFSTLSEYLKRKHPCNEYLVQKMPSALSNGLI